MKKYLLGFVAVLFALGLSAFNHVPEKTSLTDPYWYKVNVTDSRVTQIVGQMSKNAAKIATNCNNTSTILCARGYNSDPGYSVGDLASLGDDFINKN